MVIKTYFNKSNTLYSDSNTNTSLNPVTELIYGGINGSQFFTRYIFKFDVNKLVTLYNDKTFVDLSSLQHVIKMKNVGSIDDRLLNKTYQNKERTNSFDLKLTNIIDDWDAGIGYDSNNNVFDNNFNDYSLSEKPSNWFQNKTNSEWTIGDGVFGNTNTNIVGTQHFDIGNEDLEIDVTNYVNGLLTGDTNNGLVLSFSNDLENTYTEKPQYVGFFTNNTQTFFEPFLETTYDKHIVDDRNNFYLDKNNKLYLYVNINNQPINLDEKPIVTVFDNNDTELFLFSGDSIEHVTKGVYSINLKIDTNDNEELIYKDVWSNIKINGINLNDIELEFVLKPNNQYYNIGGNNLLTNETVIVLNGIKNNEELNKGDIKKINVITKIPYTVNQKQNVDELKYKIYIKEGKNEITVIDYHPVEITSNTNYFIIDTDSLLPQKYYIEIQVANNLNLTTYKDLLTFSVKSKM